MKAEAKILSVLFATIEKGEANKKFFEYLKEEVSLSCENGEADPLKIIAVSKLLEEAGKAIRKGCEPFAIDEADKYGKTEEVTAYGVKIVSSQSVFYEYTGTAFEQFEKKLAILKDQIKDAQTISKSTKLQVTSVDEDSGEEVYIMPALRKSKDILKLSII